MILINLEFRLMDKASRLLLCFYHQKLMEIYFYAIILLKMDLNFQMIQK